MAVEGLSERERQVIEHLERAQDLGVSLKEYAEAYQLDVRDLYNGKSQLVKKGVLPPSRTQDVAVSASDFVAVRVAGHATSAIGCRLKHPSGWVIEFTAVPEAAWIKTLLAKEPDAAA